MWPYLLAVVVIGIPTLIWLRRKIRMRDLQRALDQAAKTEEPETPPPAPDKPSAQLTATDRRRQAELKLIATMESAFDQLIALYPEGSRDNRWRDYKVFLAEYAGLIRKGEPLY